MKPAAALLVLTSAWLTIAATGCARKDPLAPAPVAQTKDTPAPAVAPEPPKPSPKVEPPKAEDTGTVKVEFDAPVDPRTVITIGGSEYTAKDLEKEITLRAGKHAVSVKPGLGASPREFTLDKGQRRVVRVFDPDRRAAEWVLGIGGGVRITADGKPSVAHKLADLPKARFHVTDVNTDGKPVTDADLENLEGLEHLRVVYLRNAAVTGTGFVHLAGLPGLNEVNAEGSKLTDVGLQHLKALTKLRWLSVDSTQVTDAGVAHLKGLDLARFGVGYTAVTDAGLAIVGGMTGLTTLWVGGTKITDAGVAHLRGHTKLVELSLGSTPVTDAALSHLEGMTELRFLRLDHTAITDAGLAHLNAHQNLRNLYLGGAKVTEAGAAAFKQGHPKCTVHR